jgi:hypothetical protein
MLGPISLAGVVFALAEGEALTLTGAVFVLATGVFVHDAPTAATDRTSTPQKPFDVFNRRMEIISSLEQKESGRASEFTGESSGDENNTETMNAER